MRPRGFTIVELLGAIVITAIAGVTAARLVNHATIDLRDASVRCALSQDVASALDRISMELRATALNTTTRGPDISAMTSTSVTLSNGFNVTFYDASLSAVGRIELTMPGETSARLLSGATSFSISPRDASGTAIALPITSAAGAASVRRLVITISAARAGASETLRTTIFLRSAAAP